MTQGHSNAKRGKIIQIDEEQVKNHLGEIVRGTVQETLNTLLDEEADRLCRAKRYERTDERQDTRAGYYARKLHTKAGEVVQFRGHHTD
ncbi:MAG: transposase [Nitrospiraceae bacterium]|nr:transposase [Nitrospiraceae bacterium]